MHRLQPTPREIPRRRIARPRPPSLPNSCKRSTSGCGRRPRTEMSLSWTKFSRRVQMLTHSAAGRTCKQHLPAQRPPPCLRLAIHTLINQRRVGSSHTGWRTRVDQLHPSSVQGVVQGMPLGTSHAHSAQCPAETQAAVHHRLAAAVCAGLAQLQPRPSCRPECEARIFSRSLSPSPNTHALPAAFSIVRVLCLAARFVVSVWGGGGQCSYFNIGT